MARNKKVKSKKTAVESAGIGEVVIQVGEIFYVEPDNITVIGLDTEDGPEHPLYDERAQWEVRPEMLTSIKAHGILQPITVRMGGEGFPEVVDGRQRVSHARSLVHDGTRPNLLVPCMLVDAVDDKIHVQSVAANELRAEDDEVTRALKVRRLKERVGSNAKVAEAFGVTTQTVRNYLRVADAEPELLAVLKAGKINLTTAQKLAKVRGEELAGALGKLLGTGDEGNEGEEAGESGSKRKPTSAKAAEVANGKATIPGKRVIRALLDDPEIGEYLNGDAIDALKLMTNGDKPTKKSEFGKLLVKHGFTW